MTLSKPVFEDFFLHPFSCATLLVKIRGLLCNNWAPVSIFLLISFILQFHSMSVATIKAAVSLSPLNILKAAIPGY